MTTEPLTDAENPVAAEPVLAPGTEVEGLPRGVDRRVLLAGTGVGCAMLLAACGGGSGSSGSTGSGSSNSTSSGSSGSGSGLRLRKGARHAVEHQGRVGGLRPGLAAAIRSSLRARRPTRPSGSAPSAPIRAAPSRPPGPSWIAPATARATPRRPARCSADRPPSRCRRSASPSEAARSSSPDGADLAAPSFDPFGSCAALCRTQDPSGSTPLRSGGRRPGE